MLLELGIEPTVYLHAPITQQMACTVFHGMFIDAIILFNITHLHYYIDITIKCAML